MCARCRAVLITHLLSSLNSWRYLSFSEVILASFKRTKEDCQSDLSWAQRCIIALQWWSWLESLRCKFGTEPFLLVCCFLLQRWRSTIPLGQSSRDRFLSKFCWDEIPNCTPLQRSKLFLTRLRSRCWSKSKLPQVWDIWQDFRLNQVSQVLEKLMTEYLCFEAPHWWIQKPVRLFDLD